MRRTQTGANCHRFLKPKVKVETHSSVSVPSKRWVQVADLNPRRDLPFSPSLRRRGKRGGYKFNISQKIPDEIAF